MKIAKVYSKVYETARNLLKQLQTRALFEYFVRTTDLLSGISVLSGVFL